MWNPEADVLTPPISCLWLIVVIRHTRLSSFSLRRRLRDRLPSAWLLTEVFTIDVPWMSLVRWTRCLNESSDTLLWTVRFRKSDRILHYSPSRPLLWLSDSAPALSGVPSTDCCSCCWFPPRSSPEVLKVQEQNLKPAHSYSTSKQGGAHCTTARFKTSTTPREKFTVHQFIWIK